MYHTNWMSKRGGKKCLRRNKWMKSELQNYSLGQNDLFSTESRRPSVENISCVSLSVTDWEKFLPAINTVSDGEEAQLDWSYLMMHWGYMDDIYQSVYYRLDLFLWYHKTFIHNSCSIISSSAPTILLCTSHFSNLSHSDRYLAAISLWDLFIFIFFNRSLPRFFPFTTSPILI